MEVRHLHPWNVSPQEAIDIQKRLGSRIKLSKLPRKIRCVAGMDVAFSRKLGLIWAGAMVFSYPDLIKLEERWARGSVNFPYIPGLLSFRELPAMLKAIKGLKIEPELILCDGQGIAHPRGLGLASHLGLTVGKPTIGCAKSRLVGEFSEVDEEKGSYAHLLYNGRVVGAVVRTRRGVKPLFVSPGNRITLEEAVALVLGFCRKYRIPEPIRQAHLLVTRLRRQEDG